MNEQLYDGLTSSVNPATGNISTPPSGLRFLESAQQLLTPAHLFCLALAWSSARISEVLALAPASIDIESGVASIQTLKRRKRGLSVRCPLPWDVLDALDREFNLRDT